MMWFVHMVKRFQEIKNYSESEEGEYKTDCSLIVREPYRWLNKGEEKLTHDCARYGKKIFTKASGHFPVFAGCWFALSKISRTMRTEPSCDKEVPRDFTRCNFCHIWTEYYLNFKTHQRLRINLSFNTIYFSTGPAYCHRANVTVNRYFRYCGSHSLFNLYPREKEVQVLFYVTSFTYHRFDASYAVIDHNYLFTDSNKSITEKQNSHFSLMHRIHFLNTSESLFSYHVQVGKIFHVLIRTQWPPSQNNLWKHVVTDGPGFLSPTLEENTQIYTCFSFQCILQVLTYKGNMNSSNVFLVEPKPLKTHLQVEVTSSSDLSFVLPLKNTNPSVIAIKGKTGHQVNVTIDKLLFKGENNFHCQYGGIVAGEQLPGGYKESPTLCKNFDGPVNGIGRSLYSLNSSTTVVLFWYPEYSSISAVINVSATPCSSIHFHYSLFHRLCKQPDETRYLGLMGVHYACFDYLAHITRFSYVSISPVERSSFGSGQDDRPFTLSFSFRKQESCVVLLFLSGPDKQWERSHPNVENCVVPQDPEEKWVTDEDHPGMLFGTSEKPQCTPELDHKVTDVAPAKTSIPNQEIQYTVRGFFSSFLTNFEQHVHLVDCLQFSLLPPSLRTLLPSEGPECNIGRIYYNFKIHSPFEQNAFTMHTSLMHLTQNWLEISLASSLTNHTRGQSMLIHFDSAKALAAASVENIPSTTTHRDFIMQASTSHGNAKEFHVAMETQFLTDLGTDGRYRQQGAGLNRRRSLWSDGADITPFGMHLVSGSRVLVPKGVSRGVGPRGGSRTSGVGPGVGGPRVGPGVGGPWVGPGVGGPRVGPAVRGTFPQPACPLQTMVCIHQVVPPKVFSDIPHCVHSCCH